MNKNTSILDRIISSPQGVSAGHIEATGSISRASVNRHLKELLEQGLITARGDGSARIYVDADPFRPLRQYFDLPLTQRAFAGFDERKLDFVAALDSAALLNETSHCAALDKKNMVQFLVDFSCASSALEGGTYSLLDTQALIEYGEKADDKPVADAFLVLNHKRAFEYLFDHPRLDSIVTVNRLLVDDHGLDSLQEAQHFLSRDHQGIREYEDVQIALSTYAPPLHSAIAVKGCVVAREDPCGLNPGTGYVKKLLTRVLDTAKSIENPLESAFYLLTRIPYVQPFMDGNKRTARAICNVPLLEAGLPPISFMDFKKKDYILSMLAFYELGDARMAASVFSSAYVSSCSRMLPPAHMMNYQP